MDETIERNDIGPFPKPTTDSMFKEMMDQFSGENGRLLKDFLENMMCLKEGAIKEISFVGNELQSEYSDKKSVRLDLLVEVNNELVDVEMQVAKEKNFADRSLYYWSKIFGNQLYKSDNYNKLKKTVCINIVDFDMFDCPGYHSVFEVVERERHESLTDKFEIHFYELNKVGDTLDENNRQLLWLKLFCVKSEEDLDMLAKTNVKEIQDAVVIVRKLTRSERMRDMARRLEEGRLDENTRLDDARNEGMEKGAAEEKERNRVRREKDIEMTVALMRKNNFPEDQIQIYLKNMQESAERDQDDSQE